MSKYEARDQHYFDAFPDAKSPNRYLPEDLQDTSEIVALEPHLQLLDEETKAQIRLLLESDYKHGDPHTGRLGDWYLQLLVQSNLKKMPYFVDYGRSAIDAIPRHDFIEVVLDNKYMHRQRGAMFSLAVDTVVENDFDYHRKRLKLSMTHDQWIRKKWATAFEILHHHPEGMPSTDDILRRGYLIDIEKLKRESGNLGDIFEPYAALEHVIEHLEHERQPDFNREEIEAIRTHTLLVAAADKLDQLTPTEISSNRTLLLNPGRDLYRPYKRNMTLKKEFNERVEQGSQSECDDDLSRFLFEMCRTDAFIEAPRAVQRTYTIALREKTRFLNKAVQQFLQYDFQPFVSIYDVMEHGIKDNILLGLGYGQKDRESIFRYADSSERIRSILELYRFDSRLLDSAIETIRGERAMVLGILDDKYIRLGNDQLLTGYHTQRIIQLLDMAVNTMEANLPSLRGSLELPYVSYYPIKFRQYQKESISTEE